MLMYDILFLVKNYSKQLWPINPNRRFSFLKERDYNYLFLQFVKSILRQAKIKNKLRRGTNISEQAFVTKLDIPTSPTDFVDVNRFIAF